jgi:hypothetical protein
MLNDDILEEFYSDFVNPLTLVLRENKPLRICVVQWGVNRQMTQGMVKVSPIIELLQRVHGSRYITNLDLSSAFLQIPLTISPRKWTAFNYENQVYQFIRRHCPPQFWVRRSLGNACFGHYYAHHQELVKLPLQCGSGRVLSRGRPRLRTRPLLHSYGNQRMQRQFDGLLMMGIIMLKTC